MMAKVAYDAVREEHPNIRPFILSRAGFAGLQHWAHTWSGDNGSTWEYLRSNVTTMLGVSLSGVAFNGMDIGGFTGPAPSAELFLRWVQNGVFHPRFCIHSANADNTVSEPWMHESVKPYVVDAMQFRYRLMPYLYQLAYRAHTAAEPICSPLLYQFWADETCRNENLDFMLGDACFVPAILHEGQRHKEQYFPKGTQFIHCETGKWIEGGTTQTIATPLESIAWYLQAGKWMVTSRATNSDDFEFLTTLTPSTFDFYWDDGSTFNYQKDEKLEISFTLIESNNNFQLNWEAQGKLTDWTQSHVELKLYSQHGCPMSIQLGDSSIDQVLYRDEWDSKQEGFWFNHDAQCIEIKLTAQRFNENVKMDLNFTNMIAVSI
jgi:alpha-glucosidase